MTTDDAHRGLVIAYTGDGKGKTTAALGLAMRAVGHGQRVLFAQFIKQRVCGEHKAAERLRPEMEVLMAGRGFIRGEPTEEDRRAIREGWERVVAAAASDRYGMIVLDEISYPMKLKLIPTEAVLDLLSNRPDRLAIVFTGRDMPQEILDCADLVTHMTYIKHPYQTGRNVAPGIEF